MDPCEDYRIDITLSVDGGEPLSAEIERHLKDCPGCVRHREAEQRLQETIRGALASGSEPVIPRSRFPRKITATERLHVGAAFAVACFVLYFSSLIVPPGVRHTVRLLRVGWVLTHNLASSLWQVSGTGAAVTTLILGTAAFLLLRKMVYLWQSTRRY